MDSSPIPDPAVNSQEAKSRRAQLQRGSVCLKLLLDIRHRDRIRVENPAIA